MRTFSLALALALPASAQAACVVLDTERDNLGPEDQQAATVLLEDALRDSGHAVDSAPCDDSWTVHHTRLGDSITVRLAHGSASDKLAVTGLEELPVAYERLVRAITDGRPAADSADRSSVTSAQTENKRVATDSLAYLQLGIGAMPLDARVGPSLGAGYRFELDRFGIDVGFDVTFSTNPDDEFLSGRGKLAGQYFFDDQASATPYAGAGIALGGTVVGDDSFFGVEALGSLGYSFLRETQIRVFPQLDFIAPIGTTQGGDWSPTARLTVGVAYVPPGRRIRARSPTGG